MNRTMKEIIEHYNWLKSKHDAMLLFRIGASYKCYKHDAETLAKVCGFGLEKKDGIYISSFTNEKLYDVMKKLLAAGHRIAICENPTELKPNKQAVQ